MLDQQHGDAEPIADLRITSREPIQLLMVEARRRLVEQQQLRLRRQRARELDALLGAERQIGHDALGNRCQAEKLGQFRRPALQQPLFPSNQRQRDCVVKNPPWVRQWPPIMMFSRTSAIGTARGSGTCGRCRARRHVDRVARQRAPFEGDRALVEAVEARETVEQRGLACAIGPDQPGNLAARDVEADRSSAITPPNRTVMPSMVSICIQP